MKAAFGSLPARFIAAAFLFLLALPVSAKSLHWSSFDVQARLEANGDLHVVERQTMVFDGDWNGGERIFRTSGRQRLRINRIVRLDEGRETPVEQGDLSQVNRWDYAGDNTIRWRSRMPSDPAFANQTITYVIDHTYSNILEAGASEKEFRLSHDFGMPRRDGAIERFTLRLEFDPVWNSAPVTIERTNVAPGGSAVVSRTFVYGGPGDPPGFHRPPPVWIGLVILAAFVAAVAFLLLRFFAGERAIGRFAPLEPRFDKSLLELPPEIAGAVWDAGIGEAEVAAILARMTQEGKLSTRTEDETLHMHLRVDRDSLLGYERLLIDKLFFDGRKHTDTDTIRSHYQSSGFNPAAAIRHLLDEKLAALTDWPIRQWRFSRWGDAAMIAGAAVLGFLALIPSEADGAAVPIVGGIVSTVLALIACGVGAYCATIVTSTVRAVLGPLILLAFSWLPLLLVCLTIRGADSDPLLVAAYALWCLVLTKLALDLMKSRETQAKLSFRRRVAAARAYFIEELKKPKPQLSDEWFPYVLAFGLGKHIDQWFRAFGGAAHTPSTSNWSSSSSSSSSSRSSFTPSWTGGGGAFGGAGASGTWAAAAGVMAAGVAAPSSSGSGSSSGGGGGGGSSSSGGGGGGGW